MCYVVHVMSDTVGLTDGPGRRSRLGEELLARLDRKHVRVLRLPDDWPLVDEVAGDRTASQSLVFRLHQKGTLRQIKRGAYAVRPRSRTLSLSALDLIGPIGPDTHLVTGGAALARHGLSDQSFRTVVVLVPTPQRGWEWQGEKVKYVVQPSDRIWGGAPLRMDRAPTVVARRERAIIDSLAHPAWGVSLPQVVEALQRALVEPRFAETLALAAARYDNAFLSRRLGFLVSRIAPGPAAAPFRSLIGTSRAVAALDARGPQTGEIHSAWRLRENVPFDLLAAGGNG